MTQPAADTEEQITKAQHFVPRFYLRWFAKDDVIQVLDLKGKRVGKPRPFASVCYEKFFYAAQTGVRDDVSQAFEQAFGSLETQIADRLPGIIDRAHARALSDDDFDILAYAMSLQWMRTQYFRQRIQRMQADAMKQVMRIVSSFPQFADAAKRAAAQEGLDASDEDVERLRGFLQAGEYDLVTNNASHLRFMNAEHIQGFHNLFYNKQWNILKAEATYRFITSDNPVAEWIPRRTGFYGASFLDRKHYMPLTPELLIESVLPTRDSLEVPPSKTVVYRTCSDDEVLMSDILIANHADAFAYAREPTEFERLLAQLSKPDTVVMMYAREYLS